MFFNLILSEISPFVSTVNIAFELVVLVTYFGAAATGWTTCDQKDI